MLAGHESRDRVLDLEPVADRAEIVDAVETAHRVHASRALRDYIVALLRRTRDDERVELGASPARGPDAAARGEGAGARAAAATTRSPTTSRRWPTPSSRTA